MRVRGKRRMNGEGSVSKKGPPYIARFSYWLEDGKLEESVANDVSESTRERYEQDVRLHITPLLGTIN